MIAVNVTEMYYAKEMLLLAETSDEQKMWIQRLLRRIRNRGFVHNKGLVHIVFLCSFFIIACIYSLKPLKFNEKMKMS